MVPSSTNSDSSAKRIARFLALLQLDSGERRREMERIRREDPATGAALDDLFAHDAAARAEGFLAAEAPAWTDDLAPGAAIGPYMIERLLGRGGMGRVYLAHRREPYRQTVALKRMRAELPGRLASRFDAERRILATLIHPGIVRLLDGGSDPNGVPFLVMEYVAGLRLDEHCRDHGTTPDGRVRLVHAAAEALAHAHRQGIVHRDLKPSNILVDQQGRPRVTDFGLAKLVGSTGPGDATETNMLLGTPPYMAPERLAIGPGRDDPGVDVYSLGVILFALLADRLPFESSETLEGCARAVREDAPPLRQFAPMAHRDLETITARALARDPRDRFKDAGEMAEQLGHYLAGEPLTIHPPTLVDRLARWAARRRRPLMAWAASFSLALLAMIGVLAYWNQGLRRDRESLRATMRSMWVASTGLFEALPRSNPAGLRFHGDLARSFESARERGHIGPEPALDRQGAVLIRQYAAALDAAGEPAAALPRFDRSISLLRPLPTQAEDPALRAWTEFDLFRALSGRALVLRKLGRLDEAHHDSIEALELVEGLADRFPDDPAWWEAQGRHLISHAQLLERLSRPDDARLAILWAIESARRAVELAGDNADLVKLNTLLEAFYHAMDAFSAPDEKEQSLREMCELADRVARMSDEPVAREAQTATRDWLGTFLRDQGRPAEAIKHFQRTLELVDARAASGEAGPELLDYRRHVLEALEACRRAIGPTHEVPPR